MRSSTSSTGATAGRISSEWNAPATCRRTARILRFLAGRLQPLDRRHRPAHHRLRGRIAVRHDQHVVAPDLRAQRLRVLGADPEQRAHRARPFLTGPLHRGPAHHDQLERVRQRHGVGRDHRRELPERMTRNPHDVGQPLGLEHPERGQVARQQRRLHERGGRHGCLVVAPIHDRPPQSCRCLLEHGEPGRMARPRVGHAQELRSLPREDHRVRHARQPTRGALGRPGPSGLSE